MQWIITTFLAYPSVGALHMHVAQFKLPDEMQCILKVHLHRHPQQVNSCIMCNSFEGSVHVYIVIPTEYTGSCMMFTCMLIWNV